MGCGRGSVFSVKPDWSRYAFLFDWETPEAAQAFFASSDWKRLQGGVEQERHWQLTAIHAKGLWDGQPRFESDPKAVVPETVTQLAVITRADLKPWRLRSFGDAARKATAALEKYPGVQYTLGMGELPFVRQATFSVWDSETIMKAYAYRDEDHKAAMKGKKTHGWYGEELYARFAVNRYSEERVDGLF